MVEIDWELMTKVVQDWAAYNGLSPAEFAERLGYTYQHGWNILRGKGEVRDETLGKIAIGYDIEALQDILGEYWNRVDTRSGLLATNL
jgi:transcriptional regulator with XRE-family HTH domain